MYRRYEDPHTVAELLENAEMRLESAMATEENDDYIIDLYIEVQELKDRLRFAWDDEAYDEWVTVYGY